jgi:hypothetical protein
MSAAISEEIKIPQLPRMDEPGLICFKNRIAASRAYLEYGCGGSTVYAASTARLPVIIAVDSDRRWTETLRKELTITGSTKLLIEYCDIGKVGEWGTPTDQRGIKNYWRYPTRPWEIAKANDVLPDLILIDGRFRVASFLYSLLCARVGTTILFDDYFDRPHYFVVEQYCAFTERVGRMAVFTVNNDRSVRELCARIAEYSLDVR